MPFDSATLDDPDDYIRILTPDSRALRSPVQRQHPVCTNLPHLPRRCTPSFARHDRNSGAITEHPPECLWRCTRSSRSRSISCIHCSPNYKYNRNFPRINPPASSRLQGSPPLISLRTRIMGPCGSPIFFRLIWQAVSILIRDLARRTHEKPILG